jgi:hypothetical protein
MNYTNNFQTDLWWRIHIIYKKQLPQTLLGAGEVAFGVMSAILPISF